MIARIYSAETPRYPNKLIIPNLQQACPGNKTLFPLTLNRSFRANSKHQLRPSTVCHWTTSTLKMRDATCVLAKRDFFNLRICRRSEKRSRFNTQDSTVLRLLKIIQVLQEEVPRCRCMWEGQGQPAIGRCRLGTEKDLTSRSSMPRIRAKQNMTMKSSAQLVTRQRQISRNQRASRTHFTAVSSSMRKRQCPRDCNITLAKESRRIMAQVRVSLLRFQDKL